MTEQKVNPLEGEKLLTLHEAAEDFGGVSIPYNTVKLYAYQGIKGIKLDTVYINKRYTSKEAIQRFIERRQNPCQKLEVPKAKVKKMSQEEVDAGLRKYGIIK